MTTYLIVSRHPAAELFIRWNDARFISAPAMAQATAEDVAGAIIAGNLPLHLAALAVEVVAVEFAGDPPRGQEYGLAEMEAAGARLRRYSVTALPRERHMDEIIRRDTEMQRRITRADYIRHVEDWHIAEERQLDCPVCARVMSVEYDAIMRASAGRFD